MISFPPHMRYRGAWSGATAYVVDDVVSSGGSSYVCILSHTNQVPPNATYWSVVASKGDTGATGATGPTGPAGPAPSGTGLVSVTSGVLDTPTTLSARVAADAPNLRTQLGLGTAAVTDTGTGSGNTILGNDARLTDSRTPTAHATSHKSGGTDAIKLDELAAPTDITTLNATTSQHGLLPKLGGGTSNFLRADGSWAAPTATDPTKIPLSVITQAGGLIVGTGAGAVTELAPPTLIGQTLCRDDSANKLVGGFPYALPDSTMVCTGAIAATFHRNTPCSNIAPLTSGRAHLTAIALKKGQLITGITYTSGTTALSGGNNQWFAILDDVLALLGITGDDTSTAWGSNSRKSLNLASPVTLPDDGLYYLVIMVRATTVPTLIGQALSSTVLAGQTPILNGFSTTGLTNPASCPNPMGAMTVQASFPYAEVY